MVTGITRPVLSASTIIGDAVVNGQNESLGHIKELMLDVGSGCVEYAVLSFGGFLGLGDKLFAIPWDVLHIDAENKRIVLDVPREKLELAPGFDKDNWPNFADATFMQPVHEFYEPYRPGGSRLREP